MEKYDISYESVPSSNQYTIRINFPSIGTRHAYRKGVRWMRSKCTVDGVLMELEESEEAEKFEGIKTMRVEGGHPLIVVELWYDGMVLKLPFLRKDFYLLGFHVPEHNRKIQFDDAPQISGFQKVSWLSLQYNKGLKDLWVGMNEFTDAIRILTAEELDDQKIGAALEVMIIHLAEASRYRGIENEIARSIQLNKGAPFEVVTGAQSLNQEKFQIFPHSKVLLKGFCRQLFANWSNLSGAWCSYVDSGNWSLHRYIAERCEIYDPDTLHSLLGCVDNYSTADVLEFH